MCSPRLALPFATVHNRSQCRRGVAESPRRWGKLLQVTFHVHKSGMSCLKGDAFRCAGAGFREGDVITSGFAVSG